MEEEKKKVKEKKVSAAWTGPVIRYLSLTMPVVEDEGGVAVEKDTGGVAVAVGSEGGVEGMKVGVTSEGSPPVKDDKSAVLANSALSQQNQGGGQGGVASSEPVVAMETDSAAGGGDSGANRNAESADSHSSPKDSVPPTTLDPLAMPTLQGATPTSEGATPTKDPATPTKTTQSPPNRQCRNFMVFTDTNNFPSAYFPPSPTPPRRRRRFCPVTGLPAKYIDPLTRTPYATPFAFKVIRLRYVSEAEEKCEKRLAQLSNWLEEKKKRKKMEAT